MLANRQPLLWAFVGGCLSGGLLIGFGRLRDVASPSVGQVEPNRNENIVAPPPAMTKSGEEHATTEDAPHVEPSAPKQTADLGGDAPADAGSSVADVLTRLETAYRQKLAASHGDAPGATDRTATASSSDPSGADHVPAVAAASARNAPAPADAPVTVANAAAPANNTPPTDGRPAPPTDSTAIDPERVLASRDDGRSRNVYNVYEGDVYQGNVYRGDVYQGDVYQGQQAAQQTQQAQQAAQQAQQAQQQAALLQYMQLYAPSPYAVYAYPRGGRGSHGGHGAYYGGNGTYGGYAAAAPPPSPFPAHLTDPDNPWGFNFAPVPLVK
jgi:hypothetical protein